MDFTSKVIVVTGGASGIGQAAAREFAARNGAVAIFDRDDQAGRETVEALRGEGRTAEYFHVDLGVGDQVEQAVERAAARLGGIDVLVNNAGIQRYGTAATTSEQEWDETLNANLRSAFLARVGRRILVLSTQRKGCRPCSRQGAQESTSGTRCNTLSHVGDSYELTALQMKRFRPDPGSRYLLLFCCGLRRIAAARAASFSASCPSLLP